jgi:hypothetical protein
MPTDGDDAQTAPISSAAGASVANTTGSTGAPGGRADMYWFGVGIRLGLEHPERARAMLAAIEADGGTEAPAVAPAMPSEEPAAADAAADQPTGGTPVPDGEVPVRSMLLARSATMPLDTDPAVMFGWAERLTPSEIALMGRLVLDQVAGGATKDLGRGFALAWTAGVRLPNEDLRQLFGLFSWLEITLSGVVAGRDLRSEPKAKQPSGVGALFQGLLTHADPLGSEAAAILDRGGEPVQRGLVAVWNAWVAVRFRPRIPAPLFDQLVHGWTAVVGPLPPA